jgi:two-component system cell cycle sensor histidine kinase/response regulator CckA
MERQTPARILVVDDEPSICDLLRLVLGSFGGFSVTTTTSPNDALGRAAREPFDLLLTDLKMPEMYGDELAARVRQVRPDIPVLYLTGFSEDLFRNRRVLWDREAFLDKPASPDAILEAVRLLLDPPAVPQPSKAGIMWLGSLTRGLLTLNVSGRHR